MRYVHLSNAPLFTRGLAVHGEEVDVIPTNISKSDTLTAILQSYSRLDNKKHTVELPPALGGM